MRVLFINATHFPEDWQNLSNGSQRRKKLFFDAIKEIAEIDFLYYVPPEIDISSSNLNLIKDDICRSWKAKIDLFLCHSWTYPRANSKLQQFVAEIFNFFKQPFIKNASGLEQVRAFEHCLDRKPDVIFAQRIPSMVPLMLTKRTLPPVFFDLDDIAHVQLIRQIKQSQKPITFLKYLTVPGKFWGENRAIRMAQTTFICSNGDQEYLSTRFGYQSISVIPNAVNIPKIQTITKEPNLLLLGSYDYGPNIDGANWLIEQVWPEINRVIPQAKLLIAGNKPENINSYNQNIPGVEFKGFVSNLDALYQQTRVVCCPVFSGGGTRVKMVEAAAYGKPVVATKIGAEGLKMSNEKEFFLRQDPKKFAQACLELLENYTLCKQMGAAARATAIKYYDSRSIGSLIQKHIKY